MNKLPFGEEFTLEEDTSLGQKDEVAIFLCALCGLGYVAGCILCGCEFPPAFVAGAAIFTDAGAFATVAGAYTPL